MRRTEQRQVVQVVKALIIFIHHLFYVMKFNGVKLSALIKINLFCYLDGQSNNYDEGTVEEIEI